MAVTSNPVLRGVDHTARPTWKLRETAEFAPLTQAAERIADGVVHPALGGYRFVQFSGAIDIRRQDTGLNGAVWFGCLTGGLDGKLDRFEEEVIRLVETNEPI